MIHEATGLSVRGVDRTQEAPGLGQQLTNRGGPHLGERCSSVHAAEVGQVADEVEFVGHDTQTGVLQHAETWGQRRERYVLDTRARLLNRNTYSYLCGRTCLGVEVPSSQQKLKRFGHITAHVEQLDHVFSVPSSTQSAASLVKGQLHRHQPGSHSLL